MAQEFVITCVPSVSLFYTLTATLPGKALASLNMHILSFFFFFCKCKWFPRLPCFSFPLCLLLNSSSTNQFGLGTGVFFWQRCSEMSPRRKSSLVFLFVLLGKCKMFWRMFVHAPPRCLVFLRYNLLFIIQNIIEREREDGNKRKSVHFSHYLCLIHICGGNEPSQFGS